MLPTFLLDWLFQTQHHKTKFITSPKIMLGFLSNLMASPFTYTDVKDKTSKSLWMSSLLTDQSLNPVNSASELYLKFISYVLKSLLLPYKRSSLSHSYLLWRVFKLVHLPLASTSLQFIHNSINNLCTMQTKHACLL